ncbi:hypothetical protein [Lachnotalea glycerini]|uniref:hypothetical protein n=1 Tax=Lachnotalea glycerini TaxID=1763509 RepID=UPI0014739380|nr:hypothetical protein [Lachnotalea glycerini]
MKKLISAILTLAICLVSINPTLVKAATNETLQVALNNFVVGSKWVTYLLG